jgi:hypothetical protein
MRSFFNILGISRVKLLEIFSSFPLQNKHLCNNIDFGCHSFSHIRGLGWQEHSGDLVAHRLFPGKGAEFLAIERISGIGTTLTPRG